MIISLKRQFVFLAMTKTGSSSVENRLLSHCDIHFASDPIMKHMTFRNYARFMAPMLKHFGHQELETFCLFREPIDWLGSWYRYRQRPEVPNPANSTRGISFETFVQGYISDTPPPYAKVGRPWRFVRGEGGQCGVDHVYRYDDFDRFGQMLSNRFKTPLNFPRLNVSPRMALELSPETRRAAQNYMSNEYDLYERI